MKKFIPFLLSGALVLGAAACQDTSKTSSDAPNSTNETATIAPDAESARETRKDATSETRQAQISSDERARDQRNEAVGNPQDISEDDIESKVRNTLETNLPSSQLTVAASDEGAVTITGTVETQDQLSQIDTLAKEVKGVNTVTNKATLASATSEPAASDTETTTPGASSTDTTTPEADKEVEKETENTETKSPQ
ncbi:MAG: BON domain-containing protein [Microcoleus vaginatus WJT46-NPBG5]|jgi:hypothetical protein|nr:BON domain-containing protein [Microcoleus vaginatus WJT46-NPBG5]